MKTIDTSTTHTHTDRRGVVRYYRLTVVGMWRWVSSPVKKLYREIARAMAATVNYGHPEERTWWRGPYAAVLCKAEALGIVRRPSVTQIGWSDLGRDLIGIKVIRAAKIEAEAWRE